MKKIAIPGKIIRDWAEVDFNNPEHLKMFNGAFQGFMKAPTGKTEHTKPLRAALQAYATKGDFDAEVLQILEKFHLTTAFDLAYEEIFDIKDFTGTKESGFDILDVQSGLTFAEVKTGGKCKVFKFSGAKESVKFARFGGGLMWDKDLMDDGKYWLLEDNAIEFRNKSYAAKAQSHYDLIDAVAAGKNLAWQAPTPSGLVNTDANYMAVRDINTINKACEEILIALKNKGMGVNANSQFICLAPVQLKSRLLRALGLLNQSLAGAQKGLVYNVSLRFSLMLSASDKYYIILPKQKMKGGDRLDLTLYNMFDILAYAETVAGWMRWGAAIGDQDQVRRCSIA